MSVGNIALAVIGTIIPSIALADAPCDARVADFATWAERALSADAVRPIGISPLKLPPQTPPLETIERAPVIEVGADFVALGRERPPVGTEGEIWLRDRLTGLRDSYRLLHPQAQSPNRVIVAASPDAPWELILVAEHGAFAARFQHIQFLFEDTTQVPPPPASALDPELATISRIPDGGERAERMGALLRRVYERCPAALAVWSKPDSPTIQWKLLFGRSGEAIRSCRCAVDVGAVKASFWALMTGYAAHGASVWLPDLDNLQSEAPPDRIIAFPPRIPWSIAHRKVLEAVRVGAKRVLLFTTAQAKAARYRSR